MVSYTRARAEALGVECKVGHRLPRGARRDPQHRALFAKGAGLGDFELLAPAVYVLAGLAIITTFQRILHVRKALTAPAGLSRGCNRGPPAGWITIDFEKGLKLLHD